MVNSKIGNNDADHSVRQEQDMDASGDATANPNLNSYVQSGKDAKSPQKDLQKDKSSDTVLDVGPMKTPHPLDSLRTPYRSKV